MHKKLFLFYKLPLNYNVDNITSNECVPIYSDPNFTNIIGQMTSSYSISYDRNNNIHPNNKYPLYLVQKIVEIYPTANDQRQRRFFTIEYVADKLQPIETRIKHKHLFPRLKKVRRIITNFDSTESDNPQSYSMLELTII